DDSGADAGDNSGEMVADGTPNQVMRLKNSLTGQYLAGAQFIPNPTERRKPDGRFIDVKGATENNLKNIDAQFPNGLMNVVTGVSGSGKSTLVNQILYQALAKHLYRGKHRPGAHKSVEGLED